MGFRLVLRFDKLSSVTELADPPATSAAGDDTRVAFEVNGLPVTVRGSHPHLLAALREELDITSPKDGCSPSGQCGCCTVFVDGKATVACQYDLAKVEGKSVVTLEGVDEVERQTFADAFAACGGLQCGFCIPGIVIRAKSQIDKKGAALTREGMAPHLGAHLCRCTGYVKILDAIEAVAHGTVCTPALSAEIGGRGAKYEAAALTLGDRGYIDDIRIPGMLHASLHLTDHARADVLAIDTAAALAAPGVEAVFTAADLPGELRVGLIYKDWPVLIPIGGRTSYAGDVIAVVVADTRDHARAAAELVEVTYDVFAPNTDARAALADSAPLSVWGTESNVLSTSAYTRGDEFDSAFAASAFTVHETFHTQRIEHAFLEPESTVAVPSGTEADRTLYVYSGGQGVWDDRNDIAAVLDVDPSRVTVELVSNGGAFGGKEDMCNQAQTALAAWLLDRPVKCTVSREESLRMHAKRHPMELEFWAGCDADGTLTALKVRGIGDSGAYASVGMKVLERAAGHSCGPYRWQSLDIETIAVRTNNLVCGAFRGFGANQAQFATEGVLDRLAEQVGITEIFAQQSPEQKLALVRTETSRAKTLYVGDGINDAPAMMAATVGIAIGQNSDVTAEAADVVIMDNSLTKVDEFMHISRRMRIIALQSAVGGMILSMVGMIFAASGHLSPVSGAIAQEIIDLLAVLNALRAAFPPKVIHDLPT